MKLLITTVAIVSLLLAVDNCNCLSTPASSKSTQSRRKALEFIGNTGAIVLLGCGSYLNVANAIDTPNRMDVENFLTTGMVAQPMGVSGQV
jgi:hypothetical protein